MSRILLGGGAHPERHAPVETEPTLLWVVVAGTGLAIAVVGWTDIALLWYPLQFGSPEWEFGTISRQLDGMPLGTIGLCLFVAGAIGRGWRPAVRVLSIVCLLITLELLAVSGLYLLDVPLALHGFAPASKSALIKAMFKAGVFAATYTLLYAWLGWFLWRKTGTVKG